MQQITFEKTGNFWIDNGIVGLYRIIKFQVLEKEKEIKDDFEIALTANELKITAAAGNDVLSLLHAAKNEVVKTYVKETENVGWIYADNDFRIYRRNDFRMHLKPFFTGKTPTTEGGLCVPGKALKKADRHMTTEEFEAFQQFAAANAVAQNGGKKIKIEDRGFLNSPPKHEIGDDYLPEFETAGDKICSLSGRAFKKTDTITGMDYPFLTGVSGELNFSSFLKAKLSISSKYAFVALFAFFNLNYQLSADLKNYFVLYDSNLKSLNKFLNLIENTAEQVKNSDWCNFKTYIVGTQYEAESLFNFLISVYRQLKEKLESDLREEVFSKSVFTLSNDGNIFRHVAEYTSLDALFLLFDAFANSEEEKSYFEPFQNFVRHFSKKIGDKWDTTWRNYLCANLLQFRSIHGIVERYLGEVKLREEAGGIAWLDKIIEIYNTKTQPHMKAEMVESCKSLGNRIGRYCREKEDKGILFSIRNAKSRSEFLSVLAETQFRTGVLYSEEFFKDLPDDAQWEEYKALVSIFAMNSFLYRPNADSTK